jgi:hypothetical protein
MAGETDLARMLAQLEVERRPGTFVFVAGDWPTLAPAAAARIDEDEGVTLVVSADEAHAAGVPAEPEFAWLTLTVHSSLEAVGLTAAFSRALADAGIPCNVLAGYHHDHLLVPSHQADQATQTLKTLRQA